MENKKIYEYLTVKAEWFGSLDRGTRLYYDFDKRGYVYHYESESSDRDERYTRTSFETKDYFISVDIAENQLRIDNLTAGPEIGELEFKPVELKLT